jgi:DNA invertase Pin-like site-specific DNA recombinase
MPHYGYARVSSLDQDLTLQEETLRAAGCRIVRAEKRSGAGREGRTELRLLLDFLHAGDTLVVTRIDRLARSVKDLQDIVHELKTKGVALKATEQPVDTGTAAGKAFLDMLGVFAEFETNLRRERQLEGIRAAKAKGVYKGRKPSIDPAEVRRLREAEGLGPSAIAKRLGIGRASVYRVLGGKGRGDAILPAPAPGAASPSTPPPIASTSRPMWVLGHF